MSDWQSIGAKKREQRDSKIPKEWRLSEDVLKDVNKDSNKSVLDIPRTCGILTEKEIELTEKYDATDLLRMLAKGEISSYDVTLAICKRAAIAQQLVNCLTEIFFEEALDRAKVVDEYYAKNKEPMGPFHGLPISLKDSFNVKGHQATIGYVSFAAHKPASHNSALVEILLRHGAIVYVKTNLPQTMMTADSDNNLFGRTLNPCKLSLTAGGSTGGEGALIKLRGSVLGVGTDIAGSVRLPALCDGIFGFKPTSSRVPFAGKTPPGRLGAPSAIIPCIGPEGHSVRDMELWMKTVIDSDPWELDMNAIAVPWRNVETYTRPLRLGVIMEHHKRPLHPSTLRAMKSAKHLLLEAGHSIIPMDGLIPDLWDSAVTAWKYFLLDPKKTPATYITSASEPWVPSIPTATLPELEAWNPSIDDLFDLNMARMKILHAYHACITHNHLDGFIMPAYQATAVPHDTFGMPIYTVLPNLLNFPAGSIPYLYADKDKDREFVRLNVTYEPPYHADAVEGAPCGIQVVGRPMKDEETLKIMQIVSDILKATT